MLIAHFADLTPANYGVQYKRFSGQALEALRELDWPGNVRQLKNAVVRLMLLSMGDTVAPDDVRRYVSALGSEADVPERMMAMETLSEFKEAAEKAFIEMKLRDYEWNVSEAARRMGMPRSNLYKKIERHGLARSR